MSAADGALRRRVVATTVSIVALVVALAIPSLASAEPGSGSTRAQALARAVADGRVLDLSVHSPSMKRDVPVRVLVPADRSKPRPTLYLLNGAGGGEGTGHWFEQTDIVDFVADKNVNVVVPMRGAYSYYTDWVKVDPVLGRNKWTTFLTSELPPLIDEKLKTTGVNAIAGISMAGTSSLSLAESAPQLYRAVASYSGCAETSTNLGRLAIRAVVEGRGGGDIANIWGPVGSPGWRAHDPVVNAYKLRGKAIYISTGTGVPGPHDQLQSQGIDGKTTIYIDQIAVGGAIEAATHQCTLNLDRRLTQLGIPATVDYTPGTHAWPYWQDQLVKSWPMLERALTD
ncbi:esterase family protein [Gordonia terrae]|uniref:alpha/beta hydrolase n=1 Tax=Gordonia terrae TaxID=2055 RepID=UPI00200A2A5E|nr:alpha/beta hydrolase family protein [Gordonia terrae]UPW09925.1 esterase family protein [Gordonia terrae]